jgi:hypothetical protein
LFNHIIVIIIIIIIIVVYDVVVDVIIIFITRLRLQQQWQRQRRQRRQRLQQQRQRQRWQRWQPAAAAAAVAAATPLSLIIKPDRETGDYGIFATRNKGGNLGVVSRFEDLTLFASYRYQVSGLGISCKIPNRKKTRIFQRVGQKPESSKVCLMSKIPRIFKKIRDDETRTINLASC